ncbi:PCMD domain-containing protein [uncultured Bacteroides sp.]|uniref:DUF4493 domain-containing protein n=1 Tax=uncultured Bacteroides sp. TaxID=162156 RepID=UPI002616F55C|nr:PCMD domain-containing protein [uncultured Bacteroides sp.]
MRYIKNLWILMVVLCFAACSQEDQLEGTGQGIRISLVAEPTVNVVGSRAVETPNALDPSAYPQFNLLITRVSNSEVEYTGPGAEFIETSQGTFDILATKGENLLIDANPYYTGTTRVTVGNGAVTASINCTLGNAIVSVVYPDAEVMDNVFSAYKLVVAVGEQSTELTRDNSKTYVQAGQNITYTFVATKKSDNTEISQPLSHADLPTTLNAADHCILTLKLGSALNMEISKADVKTESITEMLPMEWLPSPKLSSSTFDEATNTITVYETQGAESDASIDLKLASGLQELKFALNFADASLQEYNQEYTLSTMDFDTRDKLVKLGITLPQEGEATTSTSTPKITISKALMDKMLASDEETGAKNVISITEVMANNRLLEGTPVNYTVSVKKPEFTVAVPEEGIWSKEFTVGDCSVSEGKGNLETIAQDLTYQYSADGGNTWQPLSNGLTQVFNDCPTQKDYKVRALYRGELASLPTDITLEIPTQLPNSDMESWYAKRLGKITFSGEYYDFLPYNEGESDIWWATNNERARDYSVSRVKITSSACVSYSENIKHGGNRSALIYTSGHGGGYASTSLIMYPEGAFAGSLFIGKYDWSEKTETITPGHSFSVRPTQMKFWYKYAPKDSDVFQAYIELKNGDEVIATGTFEPSVISSETGWEEATVKVNYVNQPKAATSIFVRFLSTNKTSFSSDDFNKNKSITFPVMGDWNAHIGSMLYIDDISLVYDK